MAENEEHIAESQLGTKNYWNEFYSEEIENFNDHGDEGESWFGPTNTNRIVKWVVDNVSLDARICDLGCGNGALLGKLYDRGFHSLTGIDYSPEAITLCKKIHDSRPISFHVVDLLDSVQSAQFTAEPFDALLDKGTYDAIALMPNSDIEENRNKYRQFLRQKLSPNNGIFVLMSCNFTREELERFLLRTVSTGLTLEIVHQFDVPKISFGGVVGQQVTGLVFRRVQ